MKNDDIQKLLNADYTITVNGAHLGYLISLLANEQEILNQKAERNITDPLAYMTAAANDVVGNCMIREIYRVVGAEFLAFAMHTTAEAVTKLMEAKSPEDLERAGEGLRKAKRERPSNATLN